MADILSSADIAELRSIVSGLAMPDQFALRRDTPVSDNAGGFTTTTVTVAAGRCRLRAAGGGSERLVADRLGWTAAYAVDVHPDVSISTSDRLVVNGRDMEIGGVVDTGTWAMVRTAICQEMG